MKIVNLNLKNFRNYLDLDINFNDKLNIIIGNNAQGKTNILEAIYFLSITKSFLSVHDKTIIHKDMDYMKISGDVKVNNYHKKLAITVNDEGKKIEVNSKVIKKHMDYLGSLRVIVFSPDDIKLLKDSPNVRRKFLNIELSQLYDKYVKLLADFNVVLKQRNEYLKIVKNGNINYQYFDIIDQKYVDLSVMLYRYRNNYINELNKYIDKKFLSIAMQEGLSIKYISDIDVDTIDNMKTNMLERLIGTRNRDISYGSTGIGPHKDNFVFYFGDNNLSMYGSQGQLKMAILSLKLSEIDIFKDVTGDAPILLLDDIFSELDIEKRNKLINYINNDIQTIITTTDLNDIDSELVKIANIYKIQDGKVIDKIINN